jgi:membrane protein YqaA with SNARE-associated domain
VLQELVDWLTALGPIGAFLVSLLDGVAVPIPQGVDALVIAQAIAAPQTAYWGAALAVVGSTLGSSILYFVARRTGRVMLEKKASASGIEKIRQKIDHLGALVLLIPTMVPLPLPMKLFVIAAGVFQIRFEQFLVVIATARCVRYFGEAFVAVRYREETTAFLREHIFAAVVGAIVLIIFLYVVNRWSTRRITRG